MLTLTWDSRDLEVFRSHRVEKALVRTLSKAGGDALRFMATGSSKLVRQRKAFKVRTVKEAQRLYFPKGKQALNDLLWKMDVSGRPVAVSEFSYRQTKRGVAVTINKGRRTLIRSAFAATMQSGHVGIFRRRSKARLPIDEAFTTRVSDVFKDTGFIEYLQAGVQAKFKSSFDRLLPLELAKKG